MELNPLDKKGVFGFICLLSFRFQGRHLSLEDQSWKSHLKEARGGTSRGWVTGHKWSLADFYQDWLRFYFGLESICELHGINQKNKKVFDTWFSNWIVRFPVKWAVVVAQLVEPLTPEIRSSNPDITIILLYQMYKRKDEIKGKTPGNGPS